MNKEKIKILFKLYKKDLITEDELIILLEDTINDKVIINYPINYLNNQLNNIPQYSYVQNLPSDYLSNSNSAGPVNTSPINTGTTIGGTFMKNFFNPEEPK
jgi:hypothetical protein